MLPWGHGRSNTPMNQSGDVSSNWIIAIRASVAQKGGPGKLGKCTRDGSLQLPPLLQPVRSEVGNLLSTMAKNP